MTSTPVTIYVLWHPKAEDAPALASEIYRWFHLSSNDLLRAGMGLPVFFRSMAHDPGASTPRAIELDRSDLNVVVVLCEAHMVADPAWTSYVDEIAQSKKAEIVPVALHPSAYRMPESLRRLNFLRVDERDDAPVQTPQRLARRTERLLRQLTEVIGRSIAARVAARGASPKDRSPPPLAIFLSHAKKDGIEVAETLRSKIQHGRLRAFLDDSDLPVGHAFASELKDAAASTAAMIAIVSDAYAARPWCRHEVTLARMPSADPAAQGCWWVQPLLVVDALTALPTRNIPELGNATTVRWLPENALSSIDMLMLEVLLCGYHRLRGRRIPAGDGRHTITWTPDVSTLLELLRIVGQKAFKEVVYPGHPLPQTDMQVLNRLFPTVTFRTFDEVEGHQIASQTPLHGRLIGLSTAFNEDLGRAGLGREHLEEIAMRIARCITELGARLAFGGMLRSSGLTETLLTLVRSLTVDRDVPEPTGPVPGILSYQRWPALPTQEEIASDVGICEYVLIDSPLPRDQRLADDPRVSSPERAREHAHVLSHMRQKMSKGGSMTTAGRVAPALDARVLVGGARLDFNGFMPGLLEEALYALEGRQPIYVLGGFGGAAGLLASALLGAELPPEFSVVFHHERSNKFRALETGLAARGERRDVESLYDRLRAAMRDACQDLAGALDNGLDLEENRSLMHSNDISEVVRMLRIGLDRRFKISAAGRPREAGRAEPLEQQEST